MKNWKRNTILFVHKTMEDSNNENTWEKLEELFPETLALNEEEKINFLLRTIAVLDIEVAENEKALEQLKTLRHQYEDIEALNNELDKEFERLNSLLEC